MAETPEGHTEACCPETRGRPGAEGHAASTAGGLDKAPSKKFPGAGFQRRKRRLNKELPPELTAGAKTRLVLGKHALCHLSYERPA